LNVAEENSDSAIYSLTEDGQIVDSGEVSLHKLSEQIPIYEDCTITVTIPGENVVTLLTNLPKGSRRHLSQALPYLLEEELSAPVESLHIAFTEITNSSTGEEQLLCAVIEKTLLQSYLEKLAEVEIVPSKMIPDYWALPEADEPNIFRKDNRLLARLPSSEGFSLPMSFLSAAQAKTVLSQLLGDVAENALENIPEWQPPLTDSAPLNLLQGEFAPSKNTAQLDWLKPAAIAMSTCLILFISYFLATGWYFSQQAEKFSTQAEQRYKELFPNDKRIINIRRQMQAHLNKAGENHTSSLFFELMGTFSTAKAQLREPATIRNISFDNKQSSLQLELQTSSINYANDLQSKINNTGVNTEVLSANTNSEGVITRLRLQAEGIK